MGGDKRDKDSIHLSVLLSSSVMIISITINSPITISTTAATITTPILFILKLLIHSHSLHLLSTPLLPPPLSSPHLFLSPCRLLITHYTSHLTLTYTNVRTHTHTHIHTYIREHLNPR